MREEDGVLPLRLPEEGLLSAPLLWEREEVPAEALLDRVVCEVAEPERLLPEEDLAPEEETLLPCADEVLRGETEEELREPREELLPEE